MQARSGLVLGSGGRPGLKGGAKSAEVADRSHTDTKRAFSGAQHPEVVLGGTGERKASLGLP
ncbi:hypothetical protein Q8A73_001705 [Channa argus]|nr:hypothetical protein Q8A73_001705 [Channa argus]